MRHINKIWLILMLCVGMLGCGVEPEADLVLRNGKVWTGVAAMPEVAAVASRDGRIVAIGGEEEVGRLIGSRTRVIDLGGRRVVPGFNDAHVHFVDGGTGLASVQLRDAASEQEFRLRIAQFASGLPAGRWVLNGNWDHENWSPARLPTRQLIDGVTAVNPVFVNRLDGHMALANSVALSLAGVTSQTPDPPGGEIVRDSAGEPTGVLKDAAMSLVERVIPEPTTSDLREAVLAAMRYAAANGVTSVQDMSSSPRLREVYQSLLREHLLTVRINASEPLRDWQRLAAEGLRAATGSTSIRAGGLKGFADGSLGSTTALFFTPYLDAPTTSGLPSGEMLETGRMRERVLGADRAGLQVAIHAIGDRANQMVLDLFREAEAANGPRDRRFRIEHAQHLRPEEIARFASQRVVASMQPYHLIDDGRWAENRIGPERARGSYAFRSLLDAGATLAFGSDWFVAPMEPLMGIYAAVTRRTLDEKRPDGWIPAEKISVAEAVRAFTLGSAYAEFQEHRKGTLEPGRLADLAVLSADIFSIDPVLIRDARVVMTIAGGRVVYQGSIGN